MGTEQNPFFAVFNLFAVMFRKSQNDRKIILRRGALTRKIVFYPQPFCVPALRRFLLGENSKQHEIFAVPQHLVSICPEMQESLSTEGTHEGIL